MDGIDNKTLSALAHKGFNIFHSSKQVDFLDELNMDISFIKAYFDPNDGLPVTVIQLKTSKTAQNGHGEMHTGALCAIFDHLSSYSVFADPGWWHIPNGNVEEAEFAEHINSRLMLAFGLSRNIKMHLQRPVIAGSTVYFVTKVLENGTKSTYYFSQLFDSDGHLLASGHHDKVKLTKLVKPKL